MTPLERYQQDITLGGILPDCAQQQAVQYLQRVYEDLLAAPKKANKNSLLRWFRPKITRVKGLYLWGGVGIGKTYLMDTFYATLPRTDKLRVHFHHFMRDVQARLAALQGHADPLSLIAQEYAEKTPIICFDEFLVWDLADAMILARLLTALFTAGVTLITTSNVAPDDLYQKGLQRALFLPVITLLKQHCDIVHVATDTDYRLRHLHSAGVYFSPLDEDAAASLRSAFSTLTRGQPEQAQSLMIENRMIATVKHTTKVAWFEFDILCAVPRSQVDYLEISQRYHTIILSNVPIISSEETNRARYFINLIDVFYDAHVKLIITAAAPMEELYVSGLLSFEFKRTLSRLQEMQSQEYWAQAHTLA